MRSASVKSDLRHIRDTFSRFAAILVITALGVCIFAGIKATAPDMHRTAEAYFDEANFMDFSLLSTAGFTSGDIDAIRAVQGVKAVEPAYSVDASVSLHDTSYTVKLHSVDFTALAGGGTGVINRPQVVEGRLPQTPGECLADPRFMGTSGLHVGDSVTFTSGTDKDIGDYLKQDTYTIVGVAWYPEYISFERGVSSIGAGEVNAYFLLPDTAYSIDVYTEVYLQADHPASLSRFSSDYSDLLKAVGDRIDPVGKSRAEIRFAELKKEGADDLADARTILSDAEKKLTDGKQKLNDAQADISDGVMKITDGWNEYSQKISDAHATLDKSEKQYKAGLALWKKNREALDKAQQEYTANAAALDAAKAAAGLAGKSAAELAAIATGLQAQLALLTPADPMYAAVVAQLQGVQTLLVSQQQLDSAAVQLQQGQAQLDAGKKQLDSARAKLSAGRRKFTDAKADGLNELLDNQEKLDNAILSFISGSGEYERQRADAQDDLADARKKIADGQKQLDELKTPQWFVLDIGSNAGFSGFKGDADRIAAIGMVFPLIFFLVAALVSLTTMTRLVEDERVHIGTLKALGYSRASIASKYLLYAVSASALGSVIGFIVGFNVFPRVIFNAYQILYTLPNIQPSFNLYYAVLSTAAAVACAALPAWAVCVQSLRAAPASLMLPKAPPPGKRIFLERIRFLWKRMKFTQKVTARNLFLYKKRLIMTVVGVAGCTALILTGFGLMDSITSIVDKQYGQIRTFDVAIDLNDKASTDDLGALANRLEQPGVSGLVYLHQESVDVLAGQAKKSVYLVVPEQTDAFPRFIHLRQRADGKPLPLDDNTVIVSEKLAALYHLSAGSTVTFRDSGGEQRQATVGGVAENYVYHYIYMSPKLYASLFGKQAEPNQVLCAVEPAAMDATCTDLLDQKAVLSLTQIAKLEDHFRKMIGALKYVVAVLIVSAATLAFVVLFSLTNINIDERMRELATIKVLGFYTREMAGYIMRENVLLTVIGTACGLVLGVFLERFVIITAEVDLVMFGREISVGAFAFSALFTFFFAALVNAVMTLRLRKIDMTATLKSSE